VDHEVVLDGLSVVLELLLYFGEFDLPAKAGDDANYKTKDLV
jgi:hypothetical protein